MLAACAATLAGTAASACSAIDPEDQEFRVSGDVPADAEAVFAKAEAWQARIGWQVEERTAPTTLRLRRTLPGQNRTGRLDFETTAGPTAGTTHYEIHVWTETLGFRARENDVEMVVNAKDLADALGCPAAQWPACP